MAMQLQSSNIYKPLLLKLLIFTDCRLNSICEFHKNNRPRKLTCIWFRNASLKFKKVFQISFLFQNFCSVFLEIFINRMRPKIFVQSLKFRLKSPKTNSNTTKSIHAANQIIPAVKFKAFKIRNLKK